MADIVVTDADGRDLRVLRGCRLDVEYGDTGNDLELTVDAGSGQAVEVGAFVYVEGTEYGGVVDAVEADGADGVVRYTGRSWHGVLAGKVVEPPAGQDRRRVTGEANAVLLSLVSLLGLSDAMTASAADSGIEVDYTFERYDDGWSGVRKMLASSAARPAVAYDATIGRAVLSAVPVEDWSDGPDSDRAVLTVRKVGTRTNHLISLGEGEGRNRVVRHDYADAAGVVSQTQTLFGVDEVAAIYEYTNADAAELAEKGPEKLRELQEADSFDVTIPAGGNDYAVGDVVPGTDVASGQSVSVKVGTKIATVTDTSLEVEYKAGGTARTAGLSGSSESSGGGATYTEGEGISIVGNTISADVTEADLDEVRDDADRAVRDASDALAAAGSAQQAAQVAQGTADGAQAAAEAAQGAADGAAGAAQAAQGAADTAKAAADAAQATADGKAPASHTHKVEDVTDFPESMPASDVPAWAKEPEKPAYTAQEVGAAPASHTHSYAGSSEAGGAATSALRLAEAVTVSVSGAVSGSAEWDGSSDLSLTVEGDSEAAGFLAAHPVGSVFSSSSAVSPAESYGGTWKRVPSLGAFKWEREA